MRSLVWSIIIAAILLAGGLYHGRATDRWSDVAGDDNPGKCFADMPSEYGDWRGEPLARQAEDDSKTAVANFKFTHRLTGRWILTSITSGRGARVSIHNPEHCYLGSGYKVVDAIREDTIVLGPGREAKFWTAHFQKKKPSGIESIRIYWGWTSSGDWQAPNYPRLVYAGQPRLHKLYMIHPVGDESKDDVAPFREFMVRYLDELNAHLRQ